MLPCRDGPAAAESPHAAPVPSSHPSVVDPPPIDAATLPLWLTARGTPRGAWPCTRSAVAAVTSCPLAMLAKRPSPVSHGLRSPSMPHCDRRDDYRVSKAPR